MTNVQDLKSKDAIGHDGKSRKLYSYHKDFSCSSDLWHK